MTTGCHLEAPQVDEQGVGSQASSPGYPRSMELGHWEGPTRRWAA